MKKTLNYSQLHEAIAAVFEEINEAIPSANWVAPSQDLLNIMLEESDKDRYRQIDRQEFGEFVRKYSGHLAATHRRNVLISAVAVPAVATLTKEIIVVVGNLLARVPNSVLFVALALASVIIECKSFRKTARKPNVITNG
uniref:EF-hand domain-containing protein n=1 Tax=Picea sitchensis TaxID=3332 RepID=C0PQR1_PICSI|nr:unknown [Picea sitchensis]